jgi:hypothetical protein
MLDEANTTLHNIPPENRTTLMEPAAPRPEMCGNNSYIFRSFQDENSSIFSTLEQEVILQSHFGILTFNTNPLQLISYVGNVAHHHFNNNDSLRRRFIGICSQLMGCLRHTSLADKLIQGSCVSFDIEYRTRRIQTPFLHRDGGIENGDHFLFFLYKKPIDVPILPTLVIESSKEDMCLSDPTFAERFTSLEGRGHAPTSEFLINNDVTLLLPELHEGDLFGFNNLMTLHATPSYSNVTNHTLRDQCFLRGDTFHPSITKGPFIRFAVNIKPSS